VFKAELIQLLIENIMNWRQALDTAIKKMTRRFSQACHKFTQPFSMLDDPEFTHVVDNPQHHASGNVAAGSLPSNDSDLLADAKILDTLGEAVQKSWRSNEYLNQELVDPIMNCAHLCAYMDLRANVYCLARNLPM